VISELFVPDRSYPSSKGAGGAKALTLGYWKGHGQNKERIKHIRRVSIGGLKISYSFASKSQGLTWLELISIKFAPHDHL
jgi:hypothetical protein